MKACRDEVMGRYANEFLRSEPLSRRAMSLGLRVATAGARRAARIVRPELMDLARRVADAPAIDATAAASVLDAPIERSWVRPGPPRVVSVIGSLAAGGAERQLALYLAEAARRGLADHTLVSLNRCEGVHAHHLPRLDAMRVPVRAMGAETEAGAVARLRQDAALRRRLRSVPAVLRPDVIDLAGEFLRTQPEVVHAWLDHANITAGIAALAVGVPRVVISLRSLNPTHFPLLHRGWMLAWYRALAADERVRFVANSREGAASYAEWIGLPPARICVVLNGVDADGGVASSPETVARVRRELAPDGGPLVCGVLRLSEEKRPLLFAAVARRVCAEVPGVRFALAGDGPLASEVREAVRPLGDRFAILGRRHDVPAILAAADLTLLTSRVEGTPNILLESQLAGTPVVAPRVGGVPDAVDDGRTGLLVDQDDLDGLVGAVVRLLADGEERGRMASAAAEFVRRRFSIDAMADGMHALYAR